MTLTLDLTRVLLLCGAAVLLHLAIWTLNGTLGWLRTGHATFTLTVSGPFLLFYCALCSAGLAGIWRVLA